MYLTNPVNVHQIAQTAQQERQQAAAQRHRQTAVRANQTSSQQQGTPSRSFIYLTGKRMLHGLMQAGEGLASMPLINFML